MYRIVGSVFKIIMLSIIMVFVFDMAFYMYRVFTLNQKIEGIMTSMQKTVTENNYLPEAEYNMYKSMLKQLADDMNGVSNGLGDANDIFIAGIGTNYGAGGGNTNASDMKCLSSMKTYNNSGTGGAVTQYEILDTDMSKKASYGTIMVVQVRVKINQPFWSWGSATASSTYSYKGEDSEKWTRDIKYRQKTLFYTYYVPCLQYQTLEDLDD